MKKLIYILILWFGATSCGPTVRQIQRNCDKYAQICVTDRDVETVIEYRDTTIYVDKIIKVPVPKYDTVTITEKVIVKEGKAYLPEVRKEFGNIWATASIYNSALLVNAGYIDSTLLVPYHDSIVAKQKQTVITKTETIELPPEKYIPGFYKFTFKWFWYSIAILFLAVWIVVIKYKAKIVSKALAVKNSIINRLKK